MHRHCSSPCRERPRLQLAIWGRPGYQGMVPTAAPTPALTPYLQGPQRSQTPSRDFCSPQPSIGVGASMPIYLHFWGPSKDPLGGLSCLGKGWLFGGWDKGKGVLDHLVGPNHGS